VKTEKTSFEKNLWQQIKLTENLQEEIKHSVVVRWKRKPRKTWGFPARIKIV
jgi:hypothetical protein